MHVEVHVGLLLLSLRDPGLNELRSVENTLEDSSDGVWKHAVENGLGPSSMATVIRWLGAVRQYSSSGRTFSYFFFSYSAKMSTKSRLSNLCGIILIE